MDGARAESGMDGALIALACLMGLAGCSAAPVVHAARQSSVVLFDGGRQRPIAVEVYAPREAERCTSTHACPVALLSAGYGISHKSYSFIASALSDIGYLVVAVEQELPSDPALATEGDLFVARTPNWRRGAANLRFVARSMRDARPQFDWQHPVLIGHSNGGDIAAWLVRESPDFAAALVTLDNRRVPLPRSAAPRVLSVRASDFPADTGVLPADEELRRYGTCIVSLRGARHDDMHDGGPIALREAITNAVVAFLRDGACGAPKSMP